MWELKTVFVETNPMRPELGPEVLSLLCDSRAEAEEWFKIHTSKHNQYKRTTTMTDPNGYVIKSVTR